MIAGRRDVAEWLEPRLEGAPPELAEAVRGLIRELDADSRLSDLDVPELLAAAALRGLDGVLGREEADRKAALRLLAADASLTYAFEAAASLGTDAEELAIRMGPTGELGRRLGEQAPAGGGMS